MRKLKVKICKIILNYYCKLLFGKDKNLFEIKKSKINLVNDLYFDGEITDKEWSKSVKKILEIK